jgi:hypothetical protein
MALCSWWMALTGQGVAFGVPGALAVVDDGFRRWLWEGEEVERCHWMDLELAARLDGLLACRHEAVAFVGRRGQLARGQGQEEEPVLHGHFLPLQPRARSAHSG